MKKLAVVLAVLFCMSLASGASANFMLNGSFENQNLDNWVLKNAPEGQWNFPADEAQDGNFAARFMDSGSGTRENRAITQMVYFPGGFTGDLTVSGWVKRYVLDGSYTSQPDRGWAAAAMYIDGEHGVTAASALPLYIGADDQWHHFSHTFENVTINSHIDFAIGWGLSGDTSQYRTFDGLLVDGLAVVPEPGSMMALGAGLMGLAGFVARRRR